MIDNVSKPKKAILIDLIHPRMLKEHAMDRLEELEDLVNTYGGIVVVKKFQKRFAPHPRTYIGTGKVEEILKEGRALGVNLLIVNDVLKPKQIYTVAELLRPAKIEVWDRIDLILKIFAKHAATTEARLEIELASIKHMGPRIFGMGMELSQQAGGIGTIGIGETNTERMKRHLKEKERRVRDKLERYANVRESHRQNRKRQNLKTASIVGYTNAGKTTLLNALTGRREYVANELFATLDTRVGRFWLPKRLQFLLLSDTIGFIKHLPPELVNAFTSTLSEAVESDVLLHVMDASDPKLDAKRSVVNRILEQLGIARKPIINVFTKIDAGAGVDTAHLGREYAWMKPVFVSAEKGAGLDELVERIEEMV